VVTALRVITYENWGRFVHHQTAGWTLVEITNQAGVPLHLSPFEIWTESIPRELRPIGSRFLFQWDGIRPEDSDSPEEVKERCRNGWRVVRPA
jgi:hypothetical protein